MTRDETVAGLRLDLHEDEAEGRQGRVERLRAAIHHLTATCATCQHYDKLGDGFGFCESNEAFRLGVGDDVMSDFFCPCHESREETPR